MSLTNSLNHILFSRRACSPAAALVLCSAVIAYARAFKPAADGKYDMRAR